MTTTDLTHTCPYCGRENQATAGAPGTRPSDGDVTVCWLCRKPGIFVSLNERLAVRKPTAVEAEELANDADVRATIAAMAEAFTPSQAATLRWGAEGSEKL